MLWADVVPWSRFRFSPLVEVEAEAAEVSWTAWEGGACSEEGLAARWLRRGSASCASVRRVKERDGGLCTVLDAA